MTIVFVVGAFVAGFFIGRYRSHLGRGAFQNAGEASVAEVLRTNFGPPSYHLMNHVTLRLDDGTTQVDHILVSRYGVFVIETKDYRGWLFADARDAKWTQVLFGYKFRFQNPLLQNRRHVEAVRDRLAFLPPEAVQSVVVFVGEAEFKTERPEGVFYISELADHLRGQTAPIMSLNRMQFCVGRLETTRLEISRETDVEHIQNLDRWRRG